MPNNIKEIVNEPAWQKLRSSLVGSWKLTPLKNLFKLRVYLQAFENELGFRRVHNYLTGTAFRSKLITHQLIDELLEEVRERKLKVTAVAFGLKYGRLIEEEEKGKCQKKSRSVTATK
jgi:hypothetical protein